jgi:hypothetical protein
MLDRERIERPAGLGRIGLGVAASNTAGDLLVGFEGEIGDDTIMGGLFRPALRGTIGLIGSWSWSSIVEGALDASELTALRVGFTDVGEVLS